jgi:hypothetical protein
MTAQRIYAHSLPFESWEPGEVGVLISRVPLRGQTTWLLLRDAPLKNMSRLPCEEGWCGTTNNISITAHGRHVVRWVSEITAADNQRLHLVKLLEEQVP